MGLAESDFWTMTLAELNRYAESYKRVQERKAREKASYDYRLADLIGYSIARLYSKDAQYPEIYDVYPAVFDKKAIEEAREKAQNQETFNWLKQFAESFNNTNTKEGKDSNG